MSSLVGWVVLDKDGGIGDDEVQRVSAKSGKTPRRLTNRNFSAAAVTTDHHTPNQTTSQSNKRAFQSRSKE
jgi:hypothetical protein